MVGASRAVNVLLVRALRVILTHAVGVMGWCDGLPLKAGAGPRGAHVAIYAECACSLAILAPVEMGKWSLAPFSSCSSFSFD